MIKNQQVMIGIPSYDGKISIYTMNKLLDPGDTPHCFSFSQSSLLAYSFNQLWCDALNARQKGVTHFLMIHADVVPEAGFLDKMMAIMERETADILSVILPIKNPLGTTTTAIDNDAWKPSRFTMRQLAKMPKTFTHPRLLINTGLMLVKLESPWIFRVHFNIKDGLERDKNGLYQPLSASEDWQFSRLARKEGARRIFATSEVMADHIGAQLYPNVQVWGKWETDEANGEARLDS